MSARHEHADATLWLVCTDLMTDQTCCMLMKVALQWSVKGWPTHRLSLHTNYIALDRYISIVVQEHLRALLACFLAVHSKILIDRDVDHEGIRILDHWTTVILPAASLKVSHRCCRLSGGLTSITKRHLTSLCSSCILRTLIKPPLPSRRLSGGRKARRSPIAMASTPKVNILRALQGSFHSP